MAADQNEYSTTEGELTATVPETIQEVREIVSDLFYKLWFEKHTLSDEQVLSLQTTMRGGHPQTAGKEEEEDSMEANAIGKAIQHCSRVEQV